VRTFLDFVRELIAKWSRDDVLAQGAALAFYMLFSLAPLLVLIIAIAGLVLGDEAVRGEVVRHLTGTMGPDAARTIEDMIARVSSPAAGFLASVASVATMLLGASGVFGHLQSVLHRIFDVPPEARSGVRGHVVRRLSSFGMVLGIGALLGLSMLLSALLAGFRDLLAARLPILGPLLPWLDVVLSLALSATLFALVFKVLPRAPIAWRHALLGGAVTALLFALGKSLIALYLGRAGGASVFGAAASLVLLLLWIYYSAQILFFGAEVTSVLARRRRL
jgi:membrane protein